MLVINPNKSCWQHLRQRNLHIYWKNNFKNVSGSKLGKDIFIKSAVQIIIIVIVYEIKQASLGDDEHDNL